MERHYTDVCSEVQSSPTEIGQKDYISRKEGLKNEIRVNKAGKIWGRGFTPKVICVIVTECAKNNP